MFVTTGCFGSTWVLSANSPSGWVSPRAVAPWMPWHLHEQASLREEERAGGSGRGGLILGSGGGSTSVLGRAVPRKWAFLPGRNQSRWLILYQQLFSFCSFNETKPKYLLFSSHWIEEKKTAWAKLWDSFKKPFAIFYNEGTGKLYHCLSRGHPTGKTKWSNKEGLGRKSIET